MNNNEEIIKKKYEDDGWIMLHAGYPDFIALKVNDNDEIINSKAIEVKSNDSELTVEQAIVKKFFIHHNIEYIIERPDIENIPIKKLEEKGENEKITFDYIILAMSKMRRGIPLELPNLDDSERSKKSREQENLSKFFKLFPPNDKLVMVRSKLIKFLETIKLMTIQNGCKHSEGFGLYDNIILQLIGFECKTCGCNHIAELLKNSHP